MRAILATVILLAAAAPAAAQTTGADASGPALLSIKMTGTKADASKFVGTWKGNTDCPKLGSWSFVISIEPSGSSYSAKASKDSGGVYREIAFKGDQITLVYSTVWKDASYVGRLVSPGRVEGTVRIQTDCTWYLTKQP
ncbi:MAG TPA: hypothetical protein VMU01_09455 [Rhizomicrobium sp.]|nr:hypothetical protein [Rhizomicrobium sp.]